MPAGPDAYSPMIADERKDALLFLACSGAKAVDIYKNAQYEGEPLPSFIPTTAARQDGKGLSQLDQYEMVEGPPVDLVMVSIGGNDAGFSDIGHTCVAPNNCAETGQKWLADLPRVAKQVSMAFAAIREEFPNTPVLVVPYPVQLNPSGCAESLLSAPEHRFLVGFVNELNSVLEHEAAHCASVTQRSSYCHFDANGDLVVSRWQQTRRRPRVSPGGGWTPADRGTVHIGGKG